LTFADGIDFDEKAEDEIEKKVWSFHL
jgi:hypothetical protein